MKNYNQIIENGVITVTEGWSSVDKLTATINDDGTFGTVTSIEFGFEGHAPITLEEANKLASEPISKKFLTGTPKSASEHTVVELVDRAKYVLDKEAYGKANTYPKYDDNSGRLSLGIIEVGTPGHYGVWTDRYPCIVTAVSKTGKQITVEDVETKTADGFDYYSNQVYEYDPTPNGNEQKARKCNIGFKCGVTSFSFGSFHKSHDVHF